MTQGVLGDWGGVRLDLYRQGIDLQIGYGNQTATNLAGGTGHSLTTIGQAYFGAGLDLYRLAGLSGGKFQLTITKRHGVNLTAKENLGLYQQVQEATGRGNVFRLTQASYEQTLLNGALTMKAGRLPVGNDFGAFGCDFMNLSFCNAPQGTLPYGYTYFYDGPVSTWAGLGRVNLNGKSLRGYIQAGVYQTNPRTTDPTNGFRLGFAGGTGVLLPVEAAIFPDLGGDRPGSYKIGAWYETSRTTDVAYDGEGQPILATGQAGRAVRGRYGFHVQIEQQITPSPEGLGRNGLSVFFNIVQFDRRTSLVDSQIATGATWTGPFASRPNDQFAVAVARTQTNPRYSAVERRVAGPATLGLGSEYVIELDYRIVPAPGLKFSPNVQWGISPGGRSDRHNVVAIGMKTSLSL
ncbi:hypothetical protein ASE78_17920 [Sphingomonas sp. Leaf25]|nr:hypothetical protein ASE78_17920 [Sphingomonas sp. Leaf25]